MSTIDTGYLATIAGRGSSANPQAVVPQLAATGYGILRYDLRAAATTNATVIKPAPGRVFNWALWNFTGTLAYLKFYDKATAPVVGTDIPIYTAALAINSRSTDNTWMANGLPFANGIAFAITAAAAESDTAAVGALAGVGPVTYV